ncbi:hypothetical protein KCP73_19300 [Salmonella enterica subsp. enterica]|nr:hypothetical protein KCP73_19300 [Salmonella enterica subsp. enterica]
MDDGSFDVSRVEIIFARRLLVELVNIGLPTGDRSVGSSGPQYWASAD